MSLLIDFFLHWLQAITEHTYVDKYQAFSSPWLFQVLISIRLNDLSFLKAQRNSTLPATTCPAFVWHHCTVYLLDLICTSVSKMFQSIFKLLDRTCMSTCLPFVKNFSLWSNCMKYKRKVLWTTTKLNEAIWIS